MSVLSFLKSILPGRETQYRRRPPDSTPIFSAFGSNIYLSDYVNNAIDRVASEIGKIEFKSIVENGDTIQIQNDDITRLFRFKPNPLQTTSDFFANVEWLRRKDRNAFIYPQYEIVTVNGRQFKRFIAFYPLKPSAVYIGVNGNQAWEVRTDFEDGSSYTLPYSDLIHMKWRRGSNTIVGGGDDNGQANDYDVIRVLDSLDKTIQGLPKSIEASLQIKGVFAANTLADADKLGKTRDDFESHIITSKSGMIATDMAGNFTPMRITPPEISDEALRFLKAVIQERYGVSAAILAGDYTGDQHSAFYQTAIEEFIVQWEQAFTACCFSAREQDVGHRGKCYYSKVAYMATKDKLVLSDLATKTRLMTLNQINEMFGAPPFAGGDVRLQSLNYADSGIVNQYQLQGNSGTGAPAQTPAGAAPSATEAENVATDVAGSS